MKRLATILACVMLAGLSQAAEPMTLAISFSGYTKTEPLTNFPVLVSLTGYAGFLSGNGYDVRFWTNSAATGSNLNYEIDTWTSSNKLVWVQVPILASNATIYATWGNSAYNSQAAYTTNGATWSNGYLGVWHMGSTSFVDSCARVVPTISTGVVTTNGVVNGAVLFSNQTAYATWPSSTFNFSNTNSFSAECWVNAPFSASQRALMGKCDAASPYSGWEVGTRSGSGIEMWMCLSYVGNNYMLTYTSWTPPAGQWGHIAVTVDGSSTAAGMKLYGSGTNIPMTTFIDSLTGSMTNNIPFVMGERSGGGQPLQGAMDEVRISGVVRSTNWIWATYQNMASNSAFQSSVFIPETFAIYAPPPPPAYSATIAFNGYTRSETLTNFPALVVISNAYGSANGYDFRFWTNSAAIGTPLNYEVDTFSASSGSPSYFWVQVPVLTNNSTIYATWGSPNSSVPQPYTTNGATWANGYGAVWHLSSTNDSSTNMATLTLTGSSLVPGLLGSSIALTGSTPYASSSASITNFPLTMSVWYKFNAPNWLANSGPILISAYNPASTKEFWVDWYNSSGTMIRNVVQDGGTYVGSYTSTPDTGWHQLTSIFPSAGTSQLFMDGKQITFTSASGSGTPTGVSKFAVGGLVYNGSTWYNSPVNGLEDEARWSGVARSTNWVWAEYLNMASNSAFQTTTLAYPQPTVFLYGAKVNGNTFQFISK